MHDLKTTDEPLDSLERRITALEQLDRIDRRLDQTIRPRLDDIERRIMNLEAKIEADTATP